MEVGDLRSLVEEPNHRTVNTCSRRCISLAGGRSPVLTELITQGVIGGILTAVKERCHILRQVGKPWHHLVAMGTEVVSFLHAAPSPIPHVQQLFVIAIATPLVHSLGAIGRQKVKCSVSESEHRKAYDLNIMCTKQQESF